MLTGKGDRSKSPHGIKRFASLAAKHSIRARSSRAKLRVVGDILVPVSSIVNGDAQHDGDEGYGAGTGYRTPQPQVVQVRNLHASRFNTLVSPSLAGALTRKERDLLCFQKLDDLVLTGLS